jgi:heparanase 1
MRDRISIRFSALLLGLSLLNVVPANAVDLAVDPANLAAVGKIDERFQSYNVESVEVTGGNFWAPYPKPGSTSEATAAGPHGTEFASDAYQKREPIDLNDQRLRMLTRALGPAYMRVSGSWANSIYFQDDDQPAKAPPTGYQGVLTREQWAGVVAFAQAVDAKILTSFATSEGARRSDGSWDPQQARRLFAYTQSLGGRIDAVELMNEPNVSRTPYAPEVYARDHVTLRNLVADVSAQTTIVGPSSTGEAGFKLFANPPEAMSTARLLSGEPRPRFDVFSHHFYGAVSQRCRSLGERRGTEVTTSVAEALSESWLARADQAQSFYKALRDRFAPGAPIWITETAQAACGGDPWSATFLDTFRYVDQLGRFARQDVSVLFHNTLAASDYALIDDVTWQPRPNYWAALLWRRLMGHVVLDAGKNEGDVHVYAHCQRDHPGGVALVAINLSQSDQARLSVSLPSRRYSLTSDSLEDTAVKLNGRPLALTKGDQLPRIAGDSTRKGATFLPPTSVTFFAIPQARNAACR